MIIKCTSWSIVLLLCHVVEAVLVSVLGMQIVGLKCWVWSYVGSMQQQTSISSGHIPQTGYLLFDNAPNSQAMLKKLREFSQTLAASDASAGQSLSQDQSESGLHQLLTRYNSVSVSSTHSI